MSKKRQTTGLPKPEKKTPPPAQADGKRSAQPLKEYRSRAEREAEIQRIVILSTIAVVAVVVLILVAALIVDQVINPQRTVASVNGDSISVSEFEQRVRFERLIANERINSGISTFLSFGFTTDPQAAFDQLLQSDQELNTLWTELGVPDQFGLRVLNQMIDERIVRDEAEARGLTVTQEEIQAEIDDFFNYDPEQIAQIEADAIAAEASAEATGEATAEGTPDPDATAEADVTAEPEMTSAVEVTSEFTATPTITPTRTPFVSPTPTLTPTGTPTPEATPELTAEATAEITPEGTPVVLPTAIATIPPPATRTVEEIRENYATSVENFYDVINSETGLSRDRVDEYFETLALRKALRESIAESEAVSNMATWANARHILVPLEAPERAQDILDAINAGESFADLARASSTDTGSGANGGELDWANIANYVEPFRLAIQDAEIGAIVGPVESEFGYHIIQVRAREEREMTETEIEQAKDEAFATWLEDTRTAQEDAGDIETNSLWTDFVPTEPVFQYIPR